MVELVYEEAERNQFSVNLVQGDHTILDQHLSG